MSGTSIAQPRNALSVSGLVKNFGKLRALDGVTFDVHQGEILGLLGPNGAGKSTTVRCIVGRVIPDAGSITVFGQPVAQGSTEYRAQIGFVPQDLALYDSFSARENLVVFGRYQGLSGKALDEAVAWGLGWAALEDRAGDKTGTLSGGMKRRLNMAAGMIHRPRLVLMDEPTVGVDPQSRERIFGMIEELRGQGVTLIYTTHYMQEAERLCDRIAIVDHGKVIAFGTRDELIRQTIGNTREIRLVCSTHLPAELAAELQREGAVVSDHTVHLSAADFAQRVAALTNRLHGAGVEIMDLTVKAPSLEAVFLHLTGRELRE